MNQPITFTLSNLPSLHTKSKQAREALREEVKSLGLVLEQRKYVCELEIFKNWHHKSGKPKRDNSDNIEKLILDAIQDATGVDDSWFDGWGDGTRRCKREHPGTPYVIVTLTPLYGWAESNYPSLT